MRRSVAMCLPPVSVITWSLERGTLKY